MASLSPILSVATVILLAGLVSRFGDAALAGFGIGTALIAMVGANIGAGRLARAHRIGWTGGAALVAGAIGTATALWPEAWAGIFTVDAAVFAAAAALASAASP